MNREELSAMPPVVRDFANYMITVSGKSQATVHEYLLDLRNFFRYMKILFGEAQFSEENGISEVDISTINVDFIKKIKLTDVYDYFNYLATERKRFHNSERDEIGISASSRARKVSSLRAFFKYLEKKVKLIDENPVAELDFPKKPKTLVRYLTLDESIKLLDSIEGENKERDYCIITFFLNCGLRVSELCGIDMRDISEDILRVLGKGNKERVVYLNESCLDALSRYMEIRSKITEISAKDKNALFISRNKNRISPSTVKWLVKKYCGNACLDPKISVHKLRHTSATLMYRNGVDVKVLQEFLGHKHLNTTEIYTHTDSEDLRSATKANPLSKIKEKD